MYVYIFKDMEVTLNIYAQEL